MNKVGDEQIGFKRETELREIMMHFKMVISVTNFSVELSPLLSDRSILVTQNLYNGQLKLRKIPSPHH